MCFEASKLDKRNLNKSFQLQLFAFKFVRQLLKQPVLNLLVLPLVTDENMGLCLYISEFEFKSFGRWNKKTNLNFFENVSMTVPISLLWKALSSQAELCMVLKNLRSVPVKTY